MRIIATYPPNTDFSAATKYEWADGSPATAEDWERRQLSTVGDPFVRYDLHGQEIAVQVGANATRGGE